MLLASRFVFLELFSIIKNQILFGVCNFCVKKMKTFFLDILWILMSSLNLVPIFNILNYVRTIQYKLKCNILTADQPRCMAAAAAGAAPHCRHSAPPVRCWPTSAPLSVVLVLTHDHAIERCA